MSDMPRRPLETLRGLLEMGAITCCITADEATALLEYVEELETQLEKIKKHERERWENAYKGLKKTDD